MTKHLLDSDERWTRYAKFYEQSQLEVLQQELPVGVVSLIEYVQEEFKFIESQQDQERVGGGGLGEYEATLILALATLPENFDFPTVRNALEVLFSYALAGERIARVGSGEQVVEKEHLEVVKAVVSLIKRMARAGQSA